MTAIPQCMGIVKASREKETAKIAPRPWAGERFSVECTMGVRTEDWIGLEKAAEHYYANRFALARSPSGVGIPLHQAVG